MNKQKNKVIKVTLSQSGYIKAVENCPAKYIIELVKPDGSTEAVRPIGKKLILDSFFPSSTKMAFTKVIKRDKDFNTIVSRSRSYIRYGKRIEEFTTLDKVLSLRINRLLDMYLKKSNKLIKLKRRIRNILKRS
jgi:hypothetical protein